MAMLTGGGDGFNGLTGGLAALVLLADGRLPAGGHAHSGGVESAVADGRVNDGDSLSGYLTGRLATSGRVDAALAVAAWVWADRGAEPADAGRLDAEASARIASPALRTAARAQGRGLLRVARRAWPNSALDALSAPHPSGPLWPLALGVAAWVATTADGAAADRSPAAGALAGTARPQGETLAPQAAATLALWSAVSGPAWAAVRLLGLDPIDVAARLGALVPAVDTEAASAAGWARRPEPLSAWLAELPAMGAPIAEIAAEAHDTWEVRLFAS